MIVLSSYIRSQVMRLNAAHYRRIIFVEQTDVLLSESVAFSLGSGSTAVNPLLEVLGVRERKRERERAI